VNRTWILQANPKMYDIDEALKARPVIYWRVPQYTDQLKPDGRALIWRAGKEAGFVGWGVFLTEPQHYDLSADLDPFLKSGYGKEKYDYYAPLRVWPAEHVAKEAVAAVLPEQRIVTAPMGTVFRLEAEEVEALQPLLTLGGYELARDPDGPFTPLPVLPDVEPAPKATPAPAAPSAKITPATFLLSSTPERPIEVTIEGDALRLLLVERDALKALDTDWDSVGIYLLLGKPTSAEASLSVYMGKAQALRSRVKTGHHTKDWTRCLLIQRAGLHPFNASDISWLERRLIDVLLEAPAIDLANKTPPPPELVPEYKAEILERTVIAALGVLGVLGAHLV
jgi:hypothetical protein